MSIFSAVGDFFRSPFEDDEEKRRRKERERQESQQRAAAKKQQQAQARSQPRQMGGPFLQPAKQPAQIEKPLGPILTNQASSQRRIQESAAKPPQQSLFGRLIRDKIDANTEADKFAREQRGESRDYRESQKAKGEKDITNPFAKVGFEFAKPVAQAANTVTSAGAGIVQSSKNIKDLLDLRNELQAGKIDRATYNRLSKEIAARGEEARYGGNRGILGVGGFYDKTSELEDKKKLAGTILQTGGNLASVMPLGKATSAGVRGAKGVLAKEVYENVASGITAEAGRQTKEGKLDPKAFLTEATIDALSPVALNKFGRVIGNLRVAGASDDVIESVARKVREADSPEQATKIIDDLDNIPKPKESKGVKLKEKLPEPDFETKALIPNVKQIADELDNRTRAEVDAIRNNPLMTPDEKLTRTKTIMDQYKEVQDKLKAGQDATTKVNADNAAKLADEQKKLEQNVVDANATDPVVAPAGETPQTKAPDTTANDTAYRSVEESLFEDAPKFEERGKSLGQILSPDRVIREKITNPLEGAASRAIGKAQLSENSLARGFGRLFQGVSREAGKSTDQLAAARMLRGGLERGKVFRKKITEMGSDVATDSKSRIYATLDPERAKELGMTKLTVEDLTPEELAVRTKLKEVVDRDSFELYKRGLITKQQYANGDYLKRAYEVFEQGSDFQKTANATKTGLLKQLAKRGDVEEKLLEQAVTDPFYLVAKKASEVEALTAMWDYGDYLVKNGIAQDVPGPGRVQMPTSKVYGPAAGKWVPLTTLEEFQGFQYTNGMLSGYDNLVSAYDSLGIRRAKKQLLTVFNPAVRLGNQFSNRVMFATMNGINPVQFNIAMSKVKGMMKEGHQLYREAVSQGLIGTDLSQADFARTLSGYLDDDNMAKQAMNWFKESYSAADDQAKTAAYVVHRTRGYSPDEAARLTQRGFQDYNSVGFFYDLAAKTPFIGNAFVRFAADAMRIAKNTALDHPLRSAATIGMWATFVNTMSRLSGETLTDEEAIASLRDEGILNPTEEQIKERTTRDKATREDRFGAPKIPFTDISMTVQTPWGEINVARFMPFYQLNDIQSPVARFLPIQGNPLQPQGWQDPLLGQVGQVIADKDFRGKSIRDPENVQFADGTSKFQFDQLGDEDKRNNLLRFLFTQNAPLGREIDSLNAARQGEEDVYGKKRSLPQAIARALGVKVEQYGSEQAADTRATEEYFRRKDEIEAEVEGMSPSVQAAYRRLTGQYKMRDEKDNPFAPGEKVNVKAAVYDFPENKWGEYIQNPELFDIMEKRAQREAAAKGAPLNPIFDPRIPRDFRLQLVQQKSIAPGDNVELLERMYQNPNWDAYQDINDEYKEKAKAYYPQSDDDNFEDEMVKNQNAPFPKKPPIIRENDAAYALYLEGKGPKPAYTEELKAAKEAFNELKWNWTNNERAKRGLPLISAEEWNNKTFGFTADKDGSGFGFGGKGNYRNDWGILGELLNASIMKRLEAPDVANTPNLGQILTRLQAGSGGGRRKPTLGASSRGQG